jgi:hypothetical protein
MKKYHVMMPSFILGIDNELFSDNHHALEDLYDLHKSFKNATTEKNSAANARAHDHAEGDANTRCKPWIVCCFKRGKKPRGKRK